MKSFEHEKNVALEACRAAGRIQMEFLRSSIQVQRKDDNSPVTEVDRRCETVIRETISRSFPQDGFLGEETGNSDGESGRRWIVDPLDGTRPYVRGIPTFSVLIALQECERTTPCFGAIHLPALGITCWAVSGQGAFLNGEQIHVSSTEKMSDALGSALGFIERSETTEGKQLLHTMKTWDYAYGFMDAYSYVAVASGKLDCCVNLLDKPWDCAAAACIVPAAGGRFSDIHGNPSIYEGTVVLSNGLLHNQILQQFC